MISTSIQRVLLVALVAVASVSSVTSAVHSSQSQSKPTIPLDRIFTPQELEIINKSNGVQITPLRFEQQLSSAWQAGLQDIQQVYSKQNLDPEQVKQMNENTTIILTSDQLMAQASKHYGLGVLHGINKLAEQAGYQPPELIEASEHKMKMYHQLLNKMHGYLHLSEQEKKKTPFAKYAGQGFMKHFLSDMIPHMQQMQDHQQMQKQTKDQMQDQNESQTKDQVKMHDPMQADSKQQGRMQSKMDQMKDQLKTKQDQDQTQSQVDQTKHDQTKLDQMQTGAKTQSESEETNEFDVHFAGAMGNIGITLAYPMTVMTPVTMMTPVAIMQPVVQPIMQTVGVMTYAPINMGKGMHF